MILRKLKRFLPLLLALLLLAGCADAGGSLETIEYLVGANGGGATEDTVPSSSPIIIAVDPSTPDATETGGEPASTTPYPGAGRTLPPADQTPPPQITEDGEYTSPEDVADYLHAYGHLPGNFITKKEAQALGWPGGDLWKYAPGKSIGGDYFGNYEGLLPKGNYHECDVNYNGGSRGAERIIYGADGSVWYTDDHYESFTQLY